MTDRILDAAAFAGLVFIGWLAVTRFHVFYDATVCWTSCG